jgi:hypothetical protein
MEAIFTRATGRTITPPKLWDTAAQLRRLENQFDELQVRVHGPEQGAFICERQLSPSHRRLF